MLQKKMKCCGEDSIKMGKCVSQQLKCSCRTHAYYGNKLLKLIIILENIEHYITTNKINTVPRI